MPFSGHDWKCCVFTVPFPARLKLPCFSSSLSRVWSKMLYFSNSFSLACAKCCVFSSSLSLSQFPSSSLPVPFPVPFADSLCFSKESALQIFFFKKRKHFCFSLQKVCNALSLEKYRESAKGTGKGIGKGTGRELEGNWERERELEKHSTSHTLKKRNWKNTAFSITPGKGNWKSTAFSIAPGKTRHFQSHPGKGIGNTRLFQSHSGKEIGKPQHFQSRPGKGTTIITTTTTTITTTWWHLLKQYLSSWDHIRKKAKDEDKIHAWDNRWTNYSNPYPWVIGHPLPPPNFNVMVS